MKLCVFSDIHGNTLYLDAVTNAWKDNTLFDRFYFLGDAVGYFFNGNQVLTKLRKMDAACVCGNHDAMLMGSLPLTEKKDEVYQLAETRNNISPENLEFIQTWPEILNESIDGLNIKFVHGTRSFRWKVTDMKTPQSLISINPVWMLFLSARHIVPGFTGINTQRLSMSDLSGCHGISETVRLM